MHLDYMNDLSCSGKKCPRKFITSKTQNKSWKDQNPFFLIGKKECEQNLRKLRTVARIFEKMYLKFFKY